MFDVQKLIIGLIFSLVGVSSNLYALSSGSSETHTFYSRDEVHTHTFVANAGESVIVSISENARWISLLAPDGSVISSDYDLVSASNLTQSGTYSVNVFAEYFTSGELSYDIHFVKSSSTTEFDDLGALSDQNKELTSGDLDSYSFSLAQGESFAFSASGTSTLWVVIFAPDGSVFGSNYSRVFGTSVSQSGKYTVVVRQHSGTNRFGTDYDLHFVNIPKGNEFGDLGSQSTKSDTLTRGDLDSYTFNLSAGESFTVSGYSPSTDLSIVVYAPDATVFDSDARRIFGSSVSQSGTYTVVVYTDLRDRTGDYELHFIKAPGANEHGSLVNGGSLSETLPLGDLDSYTFLLSGTESFAVSAGSNASLWSVVYGPDGSVVDGDENLLFGNTLTGEGTYTVVLRGRYTYESGDYDIHFVKMPGANELGLLTSGDIRNDSLTRGDIDSYTFDIRSGDEYRISANGSTNLWIAVYDPDGIFVDSDDKYLSEGSASKTGTYTLTVRTSRHNFQTSTHNYNIRFYKTGTEITDNKSGDDNDCNSVGNPIDFTEGFKFQREIDFQSGRLQFTRIYRSDGDWIEATIGNLWRHNYYRKLNVHLNESSTYIAEIIDARGASVKFYSSSGTWVLFDPDYQAKLENTYDPATSMQTGRVFTTPRDEREYYDLNGLLTRIEYLGGDSIDFTYDASQRLVNITDENGNSLSLSYDASNRVNSLTTPDGIFTYNYDSNNNLVSVQKPDTTTRQYHYEDTNFPNALTGITDENNVRFATYAYDLQGRAILSQHAGGVDRFSVSYNADDSVTITNPLGKQTTYHFQTIHGVRKIVQVEGHASTNCAAANQTYSYNADGYLISKADWKGNTITYTRDSRGLVTSMSESVGTPEERTTTYTYDSVYRLPDVITAPGLITDYDYDSFGRLVSMTQTDIATSESRTSIYSYYANATDSNGHMVLGRLHQIDGPRTDVNDITTYEYDSQYRLIRITNALGHQTDITAFDSANRPLTILDANNVQIALTYDGLGRLASSTRAAGMPQTATTSYTYDDAGNLVNVTLPNAATLSYAYDNANRLTGITDGAGNSITYTLDAAGNRTSEDYRDSGGALRYTHSYVYDELSRLIQSVEADSDTTSYAYDVNNNMTGVTDGKNNPTVYAFDGLNRLVKTTDALNGETNNSFNALDQNEGVSDPRNNTTGYSYNAFGDLLSETSPDRGTLTYTYDPAGNILTRTDARGVLTNYSYDALNRLTSVQYPADSTENLTYIYDDMSLGAYQTGRLSRINAADNGLSYIYDPRGNVIQETQTQDGINFILNYEYTLADQLTRLTYPNGLEVAYAYNNIGQVQQVSAAFDGDAHVLADNLAYEPFGPLYAMTYGNGLVKTIGYDQDYRLSGIQIPGLQNLGYVYDASGNVEQLSHGNALLDQDFGYDALSRLTGADGGYGVLAYDYDPIGNRLKKTDNGAEDNYQYPATNSRLSAITGGQNISYSYDSAGNLIQRNTDTFAYNLAGRMRSATVAGQTSTYRYNPLGARFAKTTDANTIRFVYNGTELLVEADGLGNTFKNYVYLNGQRLAVQDHKPANGTFASALAVTGTGGSYTLNTQNLMSESGEPDHAGAPANHSGWFAFTPDQSGIYIIDTQGSSFDTVLAVYQGAALENLSPLAENDNAGAEPTSKITVTLTAGHTYHIALDGANGEAGAGQLNIALPQISGGGSDEDIPFLPPWAILLLGSGLLSIAGRLKPEMKKSLFTLAACFILAGLLFQTQNVLADDAQSVPTDSSWSYIHTDHLDTPQIVTDESQSVVWEANFTPFGLPTFTTEYIENNLRFPGQHYDKETGLYYNMARYYDPTTGRYLQADPIGLLGGLNLYSYAYTNPLINLDSSGLSVASDLFWDIFDLGQTLLLGPIPGPEWIPGLMTLGLQRWNETSEETRKFLGIKCDISDPNCTRIDVPDYLKNTNDPCIPPAGLGPGASFFPPAGCECYKRESPKPFPPPAPLDIPEGYILPKGSLKPIPDPGFVP